MQARAVLILALVLVISLATRPVSAAQIVGAGGSCADIQQGNTADGTPMILFHCHGSPNQNWVLSNGTINGTNGVCLDVMGSAARDGAQVIIVQCNGRASQKWQIVDGQIMGLGGKCLDTQGGSTDDRTPLVLNSCAPGIAGQIWTIQ
jgi:cytochrome c